MPKVTLLTRRSKDLTEEEITKIERQADLGKVMFMDRSDPEWNEARERLEAAGVEVSTF